MMGIDAADTTEVVFGNPCVELVRREILCAVNYT